MSDTIYLHKDNPQARGLKQAADRLESGQIMLYSTGYSYALGCMLGTRSAIDRLYQLRSLASEHPLTLCCKDIAEIASFTSVPNDIHKLMRVKHMAAMTYVLPISKRCARQLNWPRKRHEQGFRLPTSPLVESLLNVLPAPLVTTSIDRYLTEYGAEWWAVAEALENKVDFAIDSAELMTGDSTVVQYLDGKVAVLREGLVALDL